MKIYGTWHAFLIEQLSQKENVGGFLAAIMEEYQIHGNLATVQLALQYVVEAQGGIAQLAKQTDLDPHIVSEILSSEDAPPIDSLKTVLNALGCQLSITPLTA